MLLQHIKMLTKFKKNVDATKTNVDTTKKKNIKK